MLFDVYALYVYMYCTLIHFIHTSCSFAPCILMLFTCVQLICYCKYSTYALLWSNVTTPSMSTYVQVKCHNSQHVYIRSTNLVFICKSLQADVNSLNVDTPCTLYTTQTWNKCTFINRSRHVQNRSYYRKTCVKYLYK